MKKITLKDIGAVATVVGDAALGCLKVIGPAMGIILVGDWFYRALNFTDFVGEATYSSAVRAINNSGMSPQNKTKVITELTRVNADSDFYKAVISVAKSSAFSADKSESNHRYD